MQPAAWPEPDPQIAGAVAAMYAGRKTPRPPEPVDLARYRVRRQARVGGLINEYHLVA
jgi:hypothetical protein